MGMLQPFQFFRDWVNGVVATPNEPNAVEPYRSYRKCPKCGERDFRLSDRQRARPDIYRSRLFLLKWLCLTCAHREDEIVEERE